jgi:hypothetical protein
MKEAPTQALRAVFAGIGQLLLVADRIKNREQERAAAESASAERGEPASKPAPAAAASPDTRWRSLDKTGNVRLLGAEDLADGQPDPDKTAGSGHSPQTAADAAADAASGPEAQAAPEPPAAEPEAPAAKPEAPAAKPEAPAAKPEAHAEPEPPAAEPESAAALPAFAEAWPSYDGLAVASLRARMRGLDQAQLRALVEYEQANANRETVVTMFERRIAKLELGED